MLSVDKIAMPVRKDIVLGGGNGNVGTALAANIKMTTTTDIKVARTAQLENTQIKINKAVAKIVKLVITSHKRMMNNVRHARLESTKTKKARWCYVRTVRALGPHINVQART